MFGDCISALSMPSTHVSLFLDNSLDNHSVPEQIAGGVNRLLLTATECLKAKRFQGREGNGILALVYSDSPQAKHVDT